ncbi:Kae1-associated serine/threonine protein kinase [Candidatus Woesearchaeota archaeon]|nr:Kae1-associated serine/threonine protein kinase [Candidatus Woesearchaeota archaeon]
MKELARGAESVIYEDKDTIVKDRLKKSYRIPELDKELRKQRTRREANLLQKVRIAHPKLISSDNKEKIIMEKIKGEKIRDVLDDNPKLARRIGEMVAELHDQDIIHGDLTTSNMILREKSPLPPRVGRPPAMQPKRKSFTKVHDVALPAGCGDFSGVADEHFPKDEIIFIDFGLSFHSDKVEDKAVDIHLFKQALDSKHFKSYDEALKEFLLGYEKVNKHKAIMERLRAVEQRGRYKH